MNEIRKEKLQIMNLVDEINERGIAVLSFGISSYGTPLDITQWIGTGPGEDLQILRQWFAHDRENFLQELRDVRRAMHQLLAEEMEAAKELAA